MDNAHGTYCDLNPSQDRSRGKRQWKRIVAQNIKCKGPIILAPWDPIYPVCIFMESHMQMRWQLLIKRGSFCCGGNLGTPGRPLEADQWWNVLFGGFLFLLSVVLWNNKKSGSFSFEKHMLALQLGVCGVEILDIDWEGQSLHLTAAELF